LTLSTDPKHLQQPAEAQPKAEPRTAPSAKRRRAWFPLLTGAINTVAVAGAVAVVAALAERPMPDTARVQAPLPVLAARDPAAEPVAADLPPVPTPMPIVTASVPEPAIARPAPVVAAPIPRVIEVATGPVVSPDPPGLQVTTRSDASPAVTASTTPTTVAAPSSAPTAVPPVQARPGTPSDAQFVATMDALLAPARNRTVAIEDATRVRDAFANQGNVAVAVAKRNEIVDPVAKKLVQWNLLRNGAGTAREVREFLAANADWPSRDLMVQRSEEHVFMTGGSARDIKAFFDAHPPRTAIGRAALASALLAEGHETGAAEIARRVWREGDIPALLETGFVERFGRLLTASDHKWRLDRLLLDDQRWEDARADRVAVMRRVLPFLSEAERAKASARIAVYMRAADADKQMAALPKDAAITPTADWGFAFQLAQWHRRGGRPHLAWPILLDAPTDAATAVSLDDWWEERRLSAYAALRLGDPKTAYALVKAPGALGVNARKDAAFLAGWIAMRHLDDGKLAEPHFRDLAAAADGPLSRAKAGYWLARSYQAMGQPDKVRASLEAAARNVDTFYGQLAMQELEPGRTHFEVTPPQAPTEAEAKTFTAREAVQALVIARRAGLDQSITRTFLAGLRNVLESEPEHAMIAHLAEALDDTQMAVRVAKASVARGMNMLFYSYPIHAMPKYTPLRPAPEPALLLGVARQESEFHNATKSGAGARGLLQVMPVTANHVCKDYKLKCEIERLSTDPAYNAMMASAYIGDRMDEFTGSYVLTLAGYNAGPGRARQWMREFGDPRDPKVDPIDWIHRIPFEETREYVQKVLSNITVYRARLGEPATALRMMDDLRRQAPSTKRTAAALTQSQ
jgi:soluble lytic murein transglycosylase